MEIIGAILIILFAIWMCKRPTNVHHKGQNRNTHYRDN